MLIEAKQYVNGTWSNSVSGKTATRENPAKVNEIVGSYPLSTAEETAAAIDAAHRALADWKALPGAARSEILHRDGYIGPASQGAAIEFFTSIQTIAITLDAEI